MVSVSRVRAVVLAAVAVLGGLAGTAPVSATGYAPIQLPDPDSHYTAANWAGYEITWLGLNPQQHTHHYVSARWIQPAVTCSPGETSTSSVWVGLDGDSNGVIEQTGSSASCINGRALYRGWRQFYPAPTVTFSDPVQPDDAMLAIVEFHPATGNYVATLTDSTRGWSHVYGASAPGASGQSAEVIVEAPANGDGGLWPLSNFGSVTFTQATADGTGLMHAEEHFPLTMQRPDGTPKAMITATHPYNGFTVSWRNH
jgi:hypothetical protein